MAVHDLQDVGSIYLTRLATFTAAWSVAFAAPSAADFAWGSPFVLGVAAASEAPGKEQPFDCLELSVDVSGWPGGPPKPEFPSQLSQHNQLACGQTLCELRATAALNFAALVCS